MLSTFEAGSLPLVPTPLVGRERELAAAQEALLGGVRLLTLTGPGGAGKTHLALAVAAGLADRSVSDRFDDVRFVDLTPIRDPALVLSVLAGVAGLVDREVGPAGLCRALRGRRMLLVLDNFEQILDAAPLVAELLEGCADLTILATSRAALRLRWEHELPVEPLDLPDPRALPPLDTLAQTAAVALFVERTRAILPSFGLTEANARAVAELCVRLDGLPLAIELAAALGRLLPPAALLARLERRLDMPGSVARDLPDRHRTLRTTIAWSHDLLDEDERQLFRRLAVFVGGATLDAIDAICGEAESREPRAESRGTDGSRLSALGSRLGFLASLLDKSLVRQDAGGEQAEPRVRMLETVREFALERLDQSGEAAAVGRRHTDFYAGLVEEAQAHLLGAEQVAWLDRLEQEHDNLRAALRRCVEGEPEDVERGLRLGGTLWRFWYIRGYFAEGREWLANLLARFAADAPGPARADALNGVGNLAYNQGDFPAARAFHEESLTISRATGDRRGLARSLNNLALVARRLGDTTGARALLEEAVTINRAIGNRAWEAVNLNNLGNVVLDEGDAEAADALQRESLRIFRGLEDAWGIAMATDDLGLATRRRGDVGRAAELHGEALGRFRALGDRRGIARALVGLAAAARQRGDPPGAATAGREALAVLRELGDKDGIARTLALLGGAALDAGDVGRAVSLVAAAEAVRETTGSAPSATDHLWADRDLDALQTQAGEAALASARATALGRPIEDLVDEALRQPAAPPIAEQAEATDTSAAPTPLTRREVEVARLIARGMTNRQIAAELVISERTADVHVAHILRKLDFDARAQIAAWVAAREQD